MGCRILAGAEVMSAVLDRSAVIEALHRMTSRLADSSLTAAEASLLRPQIQSLLDQVAQTRASRSGESLAMSTRD